MNGALVFTLATGACGSALMDSASSELSKAGRWGGGRPGPSASAVPRPPNLRRSPGSRVQAIASRSPPPTPPPPTAVSGSGVIGWRRRRRRPRAGQDLRNCSAIGWEEPKRPNSNCWGRPSRERAPSSTPPRRLVRQVRKPELYWSDPSGTAPYPSQDENRAVTGRFSGAGTLGLIRVSLRDWHLSWAWIGPQRCQRDLGARPALIKTSRGCRCSQFHRS